MKYKITANIENLMQFWDIFKTSTEIELLGELEITPYLRFNPEFGNDYWYFQYTLLKNGKVIIDIEDIEKEYNRFFLETEINIEWICLKDKLNYQIECTDGNWSIELYNIELLQMIKQYIIND